MKKVRIFALLLCVLMVVSMLVACTPAAEDEKKPATKSDAEETKSDADEKTEGYDFDEEEFYFVGAFIPKAERDYTQEEIDNGDMPTSYSLENEAMMDKALATENKLNCVIHMTSLPADNSAEIATMMAAGEANCDIIYSGSTMLRELYVGGLLADLKELKAIDLTDSEKWGTEDSLARTQYKGAQYGIPEVGSRYYPFQSFYYGILIQKNEAFAAWETDWTVWELVEANDWTFDRFITCLDDVGMYDKWDSKYSLGLNATNLYDAALAVNEASRIVYDEETGKYVYGLLDDAAVEAIEFARSIYQIKHVQTSECNSVNAFARNEYTFWLSNGYRVFNDIANVTTDISWIPFPYGPHSVYGVSTSAYSLSNAECVVSVFKGAVYDDDADAETQKNGVVFNELFGEITLGEYASYEDYMKHNIFNEDDTKGWEVYKACSANIHSPYYDELGSGLSTTINSTIISLLTDESSDIRTQLGTLTDAVNAQLDAELNN